MFQNARSYSGTSVNSDHRLLKTKMTTEWWKMKRLKQEKKARIDINRISNEKEIRAMYKQNLQTRMEDEPFNPTITHAHTNEHAHTDTNKHTNKQPQTHTH